MTKIAGVTMTRRQSLIALTYAVTVGPLTFYGCGGGNGGAGGKNTVGGKSGTGVAQLPPGLAGRAAEMRLFTGLTDSPIAADGKFSTNTLADMPTLATLMHNDKPVLIGFLDVLAPSNTVDAASSAMALLFTALGGWQIPTEQRRAFVNILAHDSAIATLAQTIATQMSGDPYALVNLDAQIVSALAAAVQALAPGRAAAPRAQVSRAVAAPGDPSRRSAASRVSPTASGVASAPAPTRSGRADTVVPLLALAPTGLVNGIEAVQDGDLQPGFSIINHERRPRRAHLYRVAVVDLNDVETRYPAAVAVGEPLSVPTTQSLSLLNALSDVLSATSPWSPIQSSRVPLPIEPNTRKTDYEIVVLNPTFNTVEPAFFSETRYTVEAPKWRKEVEDLNEAAYFELCFALLLEALGMGGLKYSESAFAEAIANVKNAGGSDLLSFLARARGGDPVGPSIVAFIRLVVSSDTLSKTYLTAITPIYRIANAQLAADAQLGNLKAQPLQRFRSALRVLLIIGLLASAIDIGAQVHDLNNGQKGALFTADVYIPSVRLNPTSINIDPGDSVTFNASVPGAVSANLIYAWSMTGSALANLRDDATGKVGTSFETTGSKVFLATTPSTVGTITVTVQAFAMQAGGARKSLGTVLGQVTFKDETPPGQVKIQFSGSNAAGVPLTFNTRQMPPFDDPILNQFQGNPVVFALYSPLRTTGVNDALKIEMWFDAPTVKAGTQISFGPGKNSGITLKLVNDDNRNNETNFHAASGTLTVLEVSPNLLGGFIKFKLTASMITTAGGPTTDISVTGSTTGIVKA